MSKSNDELRQIVTEALVSMVSGVTGLVPPTGPGAIPDFIQAPIDRAVEKISASLPVGVPDGYALVPVEPTQAMTEAGMAVDVAMYETHYCETQAIYEAMLAAAPAAQATAEQGDQSDNIKHLTHCDDDGCERCVNLMYFYQACDECGAWGHNDSGPCLCTKTAEQSAPGEVEEVEVVGYRFFHVDHGYIFRRTHIYEGNPSLEAHSLMTVAQHKRIVVAITFQSNEQGGDA